MLKGLKKLAESLTGDPPKSEEEIQEEVDSQDSSTLVKDISPSTENIQDELEEDEIEDTPIHSPYYREYKLLIEYKHLPKYAPSGVYVVPSKSSLFVWHGVVFIRQGLYRQGIFKFTIDIPLNYPEARPEVTFFTSVFHPQVGVDGKLNIAREIPQWDHTQHFTWHIIAYVKKIFYKLDFTNPLNPEAAQLYQQGKEKFEARVSDCVKKSVENAYQNQGDASLRFSEWKQEHDDFKKELFPKEEPKAVEENALLSWVSSQIGTVTKILNIK